MKFLPDGGVAFSNLADLTSERFGDNAKVAFEFFHLLIVHGSSVYSLRAKNATRSSISTERRGSVQLYCRLFTLSQDEGAWDSNNLDRHQPRLNVYAIHSVL